MIMVPAEKLWCAVESHLLPEEKNMNHLLTEEKVHKLMPIIEKILSRKYGKEINFIDLTIGNISVNKKSS
ncbi:hypothetical protein RCG19_15890 [Neobacillus sp. OS1-2]|uniref:hypothetical protein n=1 Tax=Neobacillus sp. OS1-2 TaxID=3070680 RepID=UPI0027E1316A|nr:hypothetical protein [Neobacillus sp. OS1-2]WML38669.1 hypothetical protein RCG19_15890 [Neobacillus sp. OS1-2]